MVYSFQDDKRMGIRRIVTTTLGEKISSSKIVETNFTDLYFDRNDDSYEPNSHPLKDILKFTKCLSDLSF